MRTILAIASLCGALAVSAVASAGFDGLTVTAVNTTVTLDPGNPSPTAVTIYRVWADFTNANDALFVWGGGGDLGPAEINSLNATATGPGSGFLNHIDGGVLPPLASASVSNSDSYLTIGVTMLNQVPQMQGLTLHSIPGNREDVTGTTIDMSTSGGVATQPTTTSGAPNPITQAGFAGDGDASLRVLLMQLVVPQGECIAGEIGIVFNNAGLAGATTIVTEQKFFGSAPRAIVQCITYTQVEPRAMCVAVKVVDENGNPIPNAIVSIFVAGAPPLVDQSFFSVEITASNGVATFCERKKNTCYTTDVTDVSIPGYFFDGSQPPNGFRKGLDTFPDADCLGNNDPCNSG